MLDSAGHMSEPSAPAAPSRAAVTFIFITVMLDMLALGMIIPVLPKLIEQFEGGSTARAAEVIGVFGTSWAVMQFLASPVLGALSDRFGRRPIILLSNLGLGLDYILMAIAPTVGWLWVGRIVSGVTSASIGTAFAYIADVTTPEKRARSYGIMGAAFGIGFIVGPALGGVLTTISPRLPFWVSASFSLTNFCYGLFILPESLPHSRRGAFSWARANPVGSLKLLRAHPQLLRFATIHFLYNLAHQSLATVFVLYTGYRYGWTATDVGWALASVGVSTAIIQAGLVGRLVARFGERRMLIAGLSFGAIGMAIYGIAPTGLIFAVGIPDHVDVGFLRAVGAGPHDAPRRADRTGQAAGRAQQHHGDHGDRRAWSVRADVLRRHQHVETLVPHRRAVPSGVRAPVGGCLLALGVRPAPKPHMKNEGHEGAMKENAHSFFGRSKKREALKKVCCWSRS